MNVYVKTDDSVVKTEIVSINFNGLYRAKKKFGKFFNAELSAMVDKLLNGDLSTAYKIFNMSIPSIFGIKRYFVLGTPVDELSFTDYFEAVRFFNKSVPNGPREEDSYMFTFTGYYYGYEGEKLVKYGVKFDRDRLVNIKNHILATCQNDNRELVTLIDKLLEGFYDVVPKILDIVNGTYSCPGCVESICKGYFESIRDSIGVYEYASISKEEYYKFAKFLNIDCPIDYGVPIKPLEEGTKSASDDDTMDKRLAFMYAQLEDAKDAHDELTIEYWEKAINALKDTLEQKSFQKTL